ncbi:bet1-like protein At1g29060 isoform X2 [Ricinus communis]|uniref:bet1-like protein At1g29060 isoform X2 n=1 Tax=Ricinus communis TaxID=3988 RepID=UPI00201AE2CC|nr:bet1-like protein At1g29060 isoform X2 [Ricinus communis]
MLENDSNKLFLVIHLIFFFFLFSQSPLMAYPYRSREGLSARPVANSEEVQLRIDPVHADLDQEILGLHKQVAQEIETEARIQNDIISDLQRLMSNAEVGVRSGMRRLNRTVVQRRSNHILQVIIFGLACFTVVYLWSKHFRR